MTTEQEFYNKLAEVLNKQFPKGGCKERGAALALNALANVFLQDALKQEREKVLEEVISYIGHDQAWGESEDEYREHFGLPLKYKKKYE